MRNRRLAIAIVAMGVALGLTACGPEDTAKTSTGAAGSSASAAKAPAIADPTADLAAAAAKLGDQTMKFDLDMSGQMTMNGLADPKAKLTQATMSMPALGADKIEMRVIGNDMYMKMGALGKALGGGKAGNKEWMHIAVDKLGEGSGFNLDQNGPAGAAEMLSTVTGVERVGNDGFKGTLDLTKSPRFADNKALGAMGDKLKKIPFTAKKDSEGRLVELTVDMNSLGAGVGSMKTTYHDFGTPVSVEAPPAAQVQEMPSQFSGILNA
ncbi:hypothetical protein [Actinoplanes sp. NPDC051859]|uniref:hypothetical protein n=1 Tax=Actinoplanes sp. NPDC051859 TaxID=3363909 RepID=UPI0037B551A3